MPLGVYVGFLGRCPAASREYAVLRNSVIEPRGSGEFEVHILCDPLDAGVLLQHARRFYGTGVAYIEGALTAGEIAVVQTKLRIEFRKLLKENYHDFIKKDVIEQVGKKMRDGDFLNCPCDQIRVVIHDVSPLDHLYSASFNCLCGRKRNPLENLPLRI
jgi:hypothetical protein